MNRRTQRADSAAWQHLYNSQRWRKLRLFHLNGEPLCRMCADAGLVVSATIVDHIKAHKGDLALFYDQSNWQSLCAPCHNRHAKRRDMTGKETPRRDNDGWQVGMDSQSLGDISHPTWFSPVQVPLTIVCGPPASGKTTYVAQHKSTGDIVLDLDTIAMQTHGKPAALLSSNQRLDCLKARNDQLAKLMDKHAKGYTTKAWLIVSEPSAAKRQWWEDKLKPQSILVIATPAPQCIARAKADTNQQRPAIVAQSIAAWWQTYTPREGETVITPESHAANA